MAKAISVYIQSTYCERLIQVEIDEEKHAGQSKEYIQEQQKGANSAASNIRKRKAAL